MLRGFAVLHLAVVGELGRVAVEKADRQVGKGQHSLNFLRWNRNALLPRIHATRATELNEIRSETLLLKLRIESCLWAPHRFFEPRQLGAILFRDGEWKQCGPNAG